MQVVVSSDERICCDEELIRRVEGVVESAVGEFELLARVEVHLADLAGQLAGERDKACRIEARASGLAPLLASHEAATLSEAIHEATDKLRRIVVRGLRTAGTAGAPLLPQQETPALIPVTPVAPTHR